MAHRPAAVVLEAVLLCLALNALGALCDCVADPQLAPRRPARGLRPHLEVDRNTAGTIDRLHSGARVGRGDVVQLSYVAAGNRFGVIVSVDGRGEVTLHHPEDANEVPRVKTRGETPLASAFELDDAPGFERFFFVTGRRVSLDPHAVVEAAHVLATQGPGAAQAESLPLPTELRQSSFLLRKFR
ncbi:MAG: hypothetical protein KUG77_06935 [Nannocystaceae bacterium]|nr:hypothetical protein [Nannocystaceae bacterium]